MRYGAYPCQQLNKDAGANRVFRNADSYKWFALNAYYNKVCQKKFKDAPKPDQEDLELLDLELINSPNRDELGGDVPSTDEPQPTATPTVLPTAGCQSPDHDAPLKPFRLGQGQAALENFKAACSTELQIGGPIGCTLYYNPCTETSLEKAVSIKMTVWQSVWSEGADAGPVTPDLQEMDDTISDVLNNCDTEPNTDEKWGGYKSIEVGGGLRMYNVSADQTGQYEGLPGFATMKALATPSDEIVANCPYWNYPFSA